MNGQEGNAPDTERGAQSASAPAPDSSRSLQEVVDEWLQPLLDLVAASDVEELSVEHQGVRVALKRTAQGAAAPVSPPPAAAEASEPELHVVHAGRVGVFSRDRDEGQRAVVEEGAPVAEGQLLGYIEVLNVRNEVHAPYAGTLERFLVESRQPVEYGQPLALIQPTAEPPVDDVE